jgi:hypothetical protein
MPPVRKAASGCGKSVGARLPLDAPGKFSAHPRHDRPGGTGETARGLSLPSVRRLFDLVVHNLKCAYGIQLLQIVNRVVCSIDLVTALIANNDALLVCV